MPTSQPAYDPAGTATVVLLRTGYTILNALEAENQNITPIYVQLFDSATAGGVTLGTTTPIQTYYVPTGAGGGQNTARLIDFTSAPLTFGFGLCYAVTTTRSGLTAPASVTPLNFRYS